MQPDAGVDRPRAVEATPAPDVSVLIAAYNAEATLAETLDSLLAQSFAGWEAIVVDDGSSDGTLALARAYASRDPRIRIEHQENAGTASARNRAAALARANYLVPLDADDYLVAAALGSQLAFVRAHEGCRVYAWGQVLLSSDGSTRRVRAWGGHDRVHEYGLRDIAFQRTHVGATLWWERTLFERLGGYRDVYAEDFDLALRAALGGESMLYNPEPLQVYRVGASSKTVARERQTESVLDVVRAARGSTSDSGAARVLDAAVRHFASSQAREEFRRGVADGAPGLRSLYLRALDREISLRDPWVWLAPLALIAPRALKPLLPPRR